MAKIYAFREDRLGFQYELGPQTVMGRAPECDLIIFDRSASRHHAEIRMMDDRFYLTDLGSTNGTLVNENLVSTPTLLEPFDTIKIGQEVFIFEPGISVVVGPAPSAIVIESLSEEVLGLMAVPAEEAASDIAPDDVPGLMALAHRLSSSSAPEECEALLVRYLESRFGMTFMSILWPSNPPARRLVSLWTSHDDKRLLLSETPFIRATRDGEALLWPSSITELSFSEGKRNVIQTGHPSLVGPLYADEGRIGLIYLENQDQPFTEKDFKAFAALLGIISPMIRHLYEKHRQANVDENDLADSPEVILSSADDQVKIVYSTAAQAAGESSSILIRGEAGTGKSSLAAYIHKVGTRKKGRLVTVNLATLPASEIEPMLFGHVGGSGENKRIGLVEQADSGTLFLRHVEYLPPPAQKLLLMTLEEGLFFTLGASRPQAVDLRVVSSTSTALLARVEAGFFREDLYSRLNGLNIFMPPLREVKNGLDGFISSFMSKVAREMGLTFTGIDPAALECLRAYNWPGNLAELRKEAGLLVLFSRNGRVAMEDLPVHLRLAAECFMGDIEEIPAPLVREAERHQLIGAMARTGGDLERVAEMLRQRPEHVIMKMRALSLDPIDYQPPIHINKPRGPGQTSVPEF